MNAGEFRLEPVLRLAANREEQMAHQVSALEQAYRAEQARLEILRHLQQQSVQEISAVYDSGRLSAPWLTQADRYAEALIERIRLQTERLTESFTRLRDERAHLVAASQERRMLEKLKEQHRRRRELDVERQEVARAAEMSGVRYVMRRNEEQ